MKHKQRNWNELVNKMNDKKQYEVLQRASLFLEKHLRESRVAELLLQHHLDIPRTAFFMNMREVIPDSIYEAFMEDVRKHAETGVPIQHLMGYEEFYGRRFSVDKHVLIPRPETEELVQTVIKAVEKSSSDSIRIVDVGTGSGVIAITLALELENAEVLGIDISPEALEIAKKNATQLDAKVKFRQGDFLQPLLDEKIKADIIVSNPPYIAETERDALSDTVKNYDPELALFAEDNGLAAYKEIIKQAKDALHPNGLLAFEIGHTQGTAIKQLVLERYPQSDVDIIEDINKKERIILAKI